MLRALLLVFSLCATAFAAAAKYGCKVKKKIEFGASYTSEQLEKGQFSVKIEEGKNGTFVSRCSFSAIAQKITCDRYRMDKVVLDENLKKYYLFRSQFDVQLFTDLSFIENNGRGGVAYGKCRFTAP